MHVVIVIPHKILPRDNNPTITKKLSTQYTPNYPTNPRKSRVWKNTHHLVVENKFTIFRK